MATPTFSDTRIPKKNNVVLDPLRLTVRKITKGPKIMNGDIRCGIGLSNEDLYSSVKARKDI